MNVQDPDKLESQGKGIIETLSTVLFSHTSAHTHTIINKINIFLKVRRLLEINRIKKNNTQSNTRIFDLKNETMGSADSTAV